MKTLSNKRFPWTSAPRKRGLFARGFLACLVVAAVCVVALPGSAVGPAGDPQKTYDDWVAANEAVKKAKKKLAEAKEKQARVMAITKSGGITEGEQRALDKARDEVAEAEAELQDAEARLEAARIELEKAIAELEDEKLKKELIRKRDGYIDSQRFTAMAPAKASVETKGGLHIVTFDMLQGQVIVNLPDDMAAGDTISGSVVVDPKGQTEEERAQNRASFETFALKFADQTIPLAQSFTLVLPSPSPRVDSDRVIKIVESTSGKEVVSTSLGSDVRRYGGRLDAFQTLQQTQRLPQLVPAAGDYFFPGLGQPGRPLEIFGPSDGNSSNTILRYGPAISTVQDFEKNTENVSGGFGLIRPLAESPRKMVFESPTNFSGPVQLMLKEGETKALAPYRNVGVVLSAPKTNLLRGERTTLTVEVRGLEGIKKDLPLQLDSKGVITMEGGNFQNLRIKPSEVTPDGRYTTNRAITGVQAGGFSVTATVIVRRFDFGLQDDTDPNRLFHFNSFTGDYIFACGGGSCRGGTGGTSGQPPAGSSGPPPPVTLTGTGKPAMKGCIITLTHNAPDRRVFARLDACTKSGDASVETTSPKTNFNITDKNTADNTVTSPPPK